AERGVDALADELGELCGRELADVPPIIGKQVAALRSYDATARLHRLAGLPTLILSGERDTIARAPAGEALARGIPGSRHEILAGAGHTAVIHDAERVNS